MKKGKILSIVLSMLMVLTMLSSKVYAALDPMVYFSYIVNYEASDEGYINENEASESVITYGIRSSAIVNNSPAKAQYSNEDKGVLKGVSPILNAGYKFSYWKADKDVTLKDGKTLKVGEKITQEQLTQVKIDVDKYPSERYFTNDDVNEINVETIMTFTAYFEKSNIEIPIVKKVNKVGKNSPEKETFTFEAYKVDWDNENNKDELSLIKSNKFKMISNTIEINGSGEFKGNLIFDIDHDYFNDELHRLFIIKEKKENKAGWSYDDTMYAAEYFEGKWYIFKAFIKDNDIIISEDDEEIMTFTNSYEDNSNRYNVNYEFISDNKDYKLPCDVLNRLPKLKDNIKEDVTIKVDTIDKSDVVVNGGKWRFTRWDKEEITVKDKDITFTGIWTFIKNSNTHKLIQKTPKTGDSNHFMMLSIMLIFSLIMIFLLKKYKLNK